MGKEYTEHKTIVTDDFKLVDATTMSGSDLIWVQVWDGGAWFSPEAAGELATSLMQIVAGHRARISAAAVEMPNLVTEALGGRDSMLVPLNELEELAQCGGALGGYARGVLFARTSLQAAGLVELVAA